MGRALRKAKPTPRSAKAVRSKASPVTEVPQYSITREASSILLLVFAIFLSASLYSYLYPTMPQANSRQSSNVMGPVGAAIAEILFSLLGWCSAVTVAWALILARAVWKGRSPVSSNFLSVSLSVFASALMAVSCATAASVILGFEGGGVIGSSIAFFTVRYVNEAGTLLLSVALFLVSFGITTGLGTVTVLAMFKSLGKSAGNVAVDTVFVVERGGNSIWSGIHAFFRGCLLSVVSLWRGLILSWRGVSSIGHLSKRAIRWTIATIAGGRVVETDDELPCENFVLGSGASRTTHSVKVTADLEDDDEEPEESDPDNVIISRRNSTVARTQGARRGALRSKLAALSKRKPTDYSTFTLPSTALLNASDATTSVGPKDSELLQNGQRLEQALSNFRIGGKVVEVQPGPVVTLYQFEPAPGVKVQKIVSLADDLALALKVASVRVYAPVPGKGTVGIEVPNAQREMVLLRDVLEVDEFLQATAPLTLALGKNTFGDPFVADLSKMPHLLIAGATGSGKSVCINSILLSLLYRNTPEDLRLIMIDPKMLELSIYEDIPHLKAPVVTSPKRARAVLWWAVEEMERRYKLMLDLGVRNIAGYNAAIGKEEESLIDDDAVLDLDEVTPILGQERLGNNNAKDVTSVESNHDDAEPLPRIVIVVDELADLMLTVGREIEELLARLAQKARAAGIHLILATQRPSVNVITGLIKANFPARISFKVASRIDSRTILDGSGSEKLLGHGDMLFMSPMTGRIKRLHAPFVSDNEVVDVVSWLRKQGAPDYDQNISRVIEKFEEQEQGGGAGFDDGDYDPLYDQAVQLVVEKGQASTSMVQRAFRIGYNRAARILDAMESDGVVGPADGSRPRDVLLRQDDRI